MCEQEYFSYVKYEGLCATINPSTLKISNNYNLYNYNSIQFNNLLFQSIQKHVKGIEQEWYACNKTYMPTDRRSAWFHNT